MPAVCYQYYTPISASIPDVCAQEHALGRALLRCGLDELYGISLPSDRLEEELSIGENGKPYLKNYPQIQFNISHCDRLAACAFDAGPVGVDVELPGYFAEILIRKALSDEEKDFLERMATTKELRQEWFFRFWTLKEAFVKMTGTGVDAPLKEISFSFFPAPVVPAAQKTAERAQTALSEKPVFLFLDTRASNQDPYHIECSVPGTRCFQQTLGSGHILSISCR